MRGLTYETAFAGLNVIGSSPYRRVPSIFYYEFSLSLICRVIINNMYIMFEENCLMYPDVDNKKKTPKNL